MERQKGGPLGTSDGIKVPFRIFQPSSPPGRYVAGRLVLEALKRSENPVTRAGLLATMQNVGVFELDGLTLSYGRERILSISP